MRRTAILILKLSCFFLLAGRAYQHLFWDIPLRTFFWDEGLLRPFIEWITGSTWQEVVTSKRYDNLLLSLQIGLGIFYGIAGVAALFADKLGKRFSWILPLSSLFLFLLSLLYFKEKFFQVAQLFEYSSQILAPLLLYFLLYKTPNLARLYYLASIAVALTFISHGLYALNLYPRPGSFVDMTISILNFSEPEAITFLVVVGWLDLAFAVGLFIPYFRKFSLYYCVIWGILTSLARLIAYIELNFIGETLHQYGFEMVLRLVHGGLPLFLLIWIGLTFAKSK